MRLCVLTMQLLRRWWVLDSDVGLQVTGSCSCMQQFLREKIKAEVEKRPYTAPPPSSVPSPSKPPRSSRPVTNGSAKDEWGDWGGGASSQVHPLHSSADRLPCCRLMQQTGMPGAA